MTRFKNIIKGKGRFFIDISNTGCGSCCSYCYVKTANEMQSLIEPGFFSDSIKSILKDKEFSTGIDGSIISLCPNTEPLKSKESIKYVKLVLSQFLKLGNPIQISTKEFIPISLLDFVNKSSLYYSQVMFNISMPIINQQHIHEPKASDITTRIKNFNNLNKYKNISFSLYLKPYFNQPIECQEEYIRIIKKYNIPFVCIGPFFKKNNNQPACTSLYRKVEITKLQDHKDLKENIVNNTDAKIFHSSICQLYFATKTNSRLNLQIHYPHLCVNCGMCKMNKNENIKSKY